MGHPLQKTLWTYSQLGFRGENGMTEASWLTNYYYQMLAKKQMTLLTIKKKKKKKKKLLEDEAKKIIILTFSSKMRKRKVALIWKETLVVGTKNLITERLDKLDESGALVFCKENNKVFVKVGRNHGRESFRLALQVANTIQILRTPLFSHFFFEATKRHISIF